MNQTLTTAQKRARTRKRKEIESEIKHLEYMLTNYKWHPVERKLTERHLFTLKQKYEAFASDEEIKGAN